MAKDKVMLDRIIDFGLPLTLFLLFFFFYNQAQFTPREMVKTTGLLSISLLGLTLAVGSLSRIFPALDFLKAHRKVWGILSFLIAFTHVSLVFIYFYKFNLYKFIDISNPKYTGILSGLFALGILLIVTLTSNQKAIKSLSPNTWKAIQTTSYLALGLALMHFFLMEQVDGNLVIKRFLGQITFWFSALVLTLRILILLIFRG